MPKSICLHTLLLVAALSCQTSPHDSATARLPHIFGNHMVLQRGRPLPIWGWAAAGERITVTLGSHVAKTEADAEGRWRVTLPAMEAGGPHELVIQATNRITFEDILIGEVWLCSGQSNMEMGLGVVKNGEQEAAAADHPQIRLFELPRNPAGQPRDDVDASWRACHPKTVAEGSWGGFSAVGYFFGRELHKELGVPVGLIDSCWGGTRIGPWVPPSGFAAVDQLSQVVDEIEQRDRDYKKALPARLNKIEAWMKATREALAKGDARLPLSPSWPSHPTKSSGRPSGLYNGMIQPLVPFGMRGAIWYQGESNVRPDDGMAYHEKMKALIGGWRRVWEQGDFPFYYLQIAPFDYRLHGRDLTPGSLPRIWEAQTASLSIPNTGMVVTTDITNLRDIHPKNKQEVGRRLALWALAKTYGREDLVYSGPIYESMSREGSKIRLQFQHVGGGLASRDGKPLSWFEIAGPDKNFVKARAEIEADQVLVWSDLISEPIAVRFAWHMKAAPNLMNKEGLPASPFRTCDW